jgi:hypothetical protein
MHRVLSLFILAGLVACQDLAPTGLAAPDDGSAAFSDAVHNQGNDRFYLLPPMVKNPSPGGIFNPMLQPRVAVCPVEALVEPPTAPGCPQPVADFTMQTGIFIPEGAQHYQVDWKTSDSGVTANGTYRVLFYLSDQPTALLLGYADVQFGSSLSEVKNLQTNETIALLDGRTLPVRFRIEEGASCAGEVDCGEAVIGPDGGIVTTVDGYAGVSIPAGAVSEDVLVTITQINPASQPWGKCLPTGLRQEQGCYDFDTDPVIVEFNESVTVAICLDPNALRPKNLALHRFNPNESQGVVELPNAPENFLDCGGFTALAFLGEDAGALDRLAAFAGRLVSPLASFFIPRTVFATDLGRGGLTDAFSSVGWAEPGDASGEVPGSAPAGATLNPVIQLLTAHNHHGEDPVAASGATLRFEYTGPDGEPAAAPWQLTTDLLGQATPAWALTGAPGIHTLSVSTRGTLNGEVTGEVVPDPTTILELRTLVSVAGLTCGEDPECGEGVIGPIGGVVTTPNKHAGVSVPMGALDGPVTITVRRVNPGDQPWGTCLLTGLRQEQGCYSFETDPALTEVNGNNTFNIPVTVAVCLDPNAPRKDKVTLHRDNKASNLAEREVFELPGASENFLNCTGFGALGWAPEASSLRWLAAAAGRALAPVRGIVVPRLAYATDLGRGGLTDAFSLVGWAEGVQLSVIGGNFPSSGTASAGANFTLQVEARTTHNHESGSQRSNATVLYAEYTAPGGTTTVLGPFNSGNAAVTGITWQLTQDSGLHSLSITTRGKVDGQLVPDPTVPLVLTVEVP